MISIIEKNCPAEWLEFINHYKKTIQFKPNTLIFNEDDPVEGIFIIKEGKVKVVAKEPDNKELLIRLAADGDILGHRGFGGDWTYPVSAITYVNTTVEFIPINILELVMKANAEFTYKLMMFFAEELRSSEEKISQIPVKNRVANAIYINYKVFGADKNDPTKISFTLSRKDYANKARTTYETVIRVLSDLNHEKIISIEGKTIRILNFDKLKTLI